MARSRDGSRPDRPSRSLSGRPFGIEPLDGLTFAAVTVAFVVVIELAAWLPSRRATRIAPAIALRDSIS